MQLRPATTKLIPATAVVGSLLAAMAHSSAAHADPADLAGFYMGAHAGYTLDANADFDGGALDDDGAFGGLQLGYGFQSGNVIWGAESDISLSGASPSGACPFNSSLSCDVDPSVLGTLRTKVGYASGDWLFYVTGGAAAGHFEVETSGLTGTSTDSEGEIGWTAGAGLEYLVGSGHSGVKNTVGVKLEYRYMKMLDGIDIDEPGGTGSSESLDYDAHIVMIGINWHF